MTTIIVPSHLPKINPPSNAIGEPKPKNGKTHNIVKIKKIMDIKNKLEFFNFRKCYIIYLIIMFFL